MKKLLANEERALDVEKKRERADEHKEQMDEKTLRVEESVLEKEKKEIARESSKQKKVRRTEIGRGSQKAANRRDSGES